MPSELTCADVAERLPAVVDGDAPAERAVLAHVDVCLRCQAELVQYRRLLRTLRQLRTELLEPAPGLVAEVLAGLAEAGERRAARSLLTGRNMAYAGGIAATAAGAVGAIVLASRARRGGWRLAG